MSIIQVWHHEADWRNVLGVVGRSCSGLPDRSGQLPANLVALKCMKEYFHDPLSDRAYLWPGLLRRIGSRLAAEMTRGVRIPDHLDHSAAMCSPFSATERFMRRHQEDEPQGQDGEQPEDVEVGQRRRLLLAEVRERLPGHLLRRGRVAGLLEEERPGLLGEGIHGRVEGVEELAHARRVELLAPLLRWSGPSTCRRCPPRCGAGPTGRPPPRAGARGVYLKAATLSGAKIIDRPTISTTRGQITCHGLMSRFISAIQ